MRSLSVCNLTVTWSVSLFSVAEIKCLEKCSLEDKGFIFGFTVSQGWSGSWWGRLGGRQGSHGGWRGKLAGHIIISPQEIESKK